LPHIGIPVAVSVIGQGIHPADKGLEISDFVTINSILNSGGRLGPFMLFFTESG